MTPAIAGRDMNVACSPCLRQSCFTALRQQDHVVRRTQRRPGRERHLELARAHLVLDRAQRQVEGDEPVAQDLDELVERVQVVLQEQLPALVEALAVGRQDVELDLEPDDELVPAQRERVELVAQHAARREDDRRAVGEVEVAEDGRRARRPGQDVERAGVGHEHDVARALQRGHAERRPVEHGVHGGPRRVLEHEARRRRDAAAQRGRERLARQRLAAQQAVLVGEGDAHELDPVLVDDPLRLRRRGVLRVVPERVALDEAGASRPRPEEVDDLRRRHATRPPRARPTGAAPPGRAIGPASRMRGRSCRRRAAR